MGRHPKIIQTKTGIDRRETGYYSTPAFISEFIAWAITDLNPTGSYALDPCVGRGEMAIPLMKRGVSVDGMDILSFNLPETINFHHQDFLEYYINQKIHCILNQKLGLDYDFYIANPPYNCHEVDYIRQNKSKLLSFFSDVGVHNMYSMFISALIDFAKNGAAIGMITLDSFLTAKAHTELRQKIINNCAIHYLILCPNDLFLAQGADVRTCIMILQKGREYQKQVKIANRPLNMQKLAKTLETKKFAPTPLEQILLSGKSDSYEFAIAMTDEIQGLFSYPRLGTLFPCVTGISTGCDREYLSKQKKPGFNIPFYKNPGKSRFFTHPNAYLADNFLSIAQKVPNFMVRNQDLLYRPGITCSSMGIPFSACYLPANSTYGVNANIITSDRDTWWLIAYLNSHLVTFMVRGILNRSNMITSGYVGRIPIPEISVKGKERLQRFAQEAYEQKVSSQAAMQYVVAVNQVIYQELSLSAETISIITNFSENILQAT